MDALNYPFRDAYTPELDLRVPLAHLLGNKVAVYLQDLPELITGRKLVISAWKPLDPTKNLMSPVRFHLAPQGFAKIKLIEDIALPTMPQDYPMVVERSTEKDLVSTSLVYPATREIWQFRIHLDNPRIVEDRECELIAEEVLVARR